MRDRTTGQQPNASTSGEVMFLVCSGDGDCTMDVVLAICCDATLLAGRRIVDIPLKIGTILKDSWCLYQLDWGTREDGVQWRLYSHL